MPYPGLQLVACLIACWLSSGRAWSQDASPQTFAGKTAEAWRQVLIEHLDGASADDKEACRRAAAALAQIGPSAEVAVVELARALKSPSLEVRHFSVDALGRIGPPAVAAVPAIVAEMDLPPDHPNYAPLAAFRRLAARALGRIGPGAQAAVPVLGKALRGDDPICRVEAALALWRILQEPRAIDFLAGMIDAASGEGTSAEGTYEAVMALGEIGRPAEPATDALVAALGHPQGDVRRAAADVLARLGPGSIDAVAERIEQDALESPAAAAYALGQATIPLRGHLYSPGIEQAAFDTAAAPARRAAQALIRLLSDERDAPRHAAQRALSQAGLLAAPPLLEALGGQDAIARRAAIETLVQIEEFLPPEDAESDPLHGLKLRVLDQLLTRMQDGDPQVRAAAFRAFAEFSFGAEGGKALPLLRRALRDENLAVRKFAAQAIRGLGSDPAAPGDSTERDSPHET